MIYLLSDIHAGLEHIDGLRHYLDNADESDLLIILGDVGVRFEDTPENREFDRLFLSSSRRIAFIDGNHENFDYINSCPEEDWAGGRVHRLTDNIVHLERGYVYRTDGFSFFTFGGCSSSDSWRESGPWYPEESPSSEELRRAYSNLDSVGRRVDFVLTHKYQSEHDERDGELFRLCSFIEESVEYRHWYAGHWHVERKRDEKHTFIYNSLIKLG